MKKLIATVCGLMLTASVLGLIGIAGGIDNDMISLSDGTKWMVIALIALVISVAGVCYSTGDEDVTHMTQF